MRPPPTLHDFIVTHRQEILERARRRVRERGPSGTSDSKIENGVPLFLTQLVDALSPVAAAQRDGEVGDAASSAKISSSAALHGHDLLRDGFTAAQVVHGYGDVCQVVTELASESSTAISSEDFQAFNGCLDDAIAGAVTAYGRQREEDLAYQGTERLGVLAHELRNLLNTALLSFDAIKRGKVSLGGSTSAIHSRSLAGLCVLVERALAEVRLEAGVPAPQRVVVAELIEEIAIIAAMQAEGFGLRFSVGAVEDDLVVDVDRQLLSSAVTNLLQNAFKFTRARAPVGERGEVHLTVRSTTDRVLIDVADECGGLPPGMVKGLFGPFKRGHSDGAGLGLGLSIALSAIRASSGGIQVRDVPGKGCVFTIDLPRRLP